ncbi:MAG TPA: ion channel, partial [Candidatus Binataceae bacterium]|nr:ion channel [Candidatus Binataceae bacterium]
MNRRRTLTRTRIGGSEPIVVGGQKPWTDLYHFLINASWPALLGFIASLFVGLNLLFALAYYLDRGIERADGFLDVFFFSVETMATIGYGRMSPITTVANILMTVEALTGLIGLAMVTGLVFAKFSIPSSRVRFSKLALIAERDGVPSLLFRMANLRANRIVEATVHIAFARDEITVEGERVRRFYDLPMVRERTPLFALSWTAVHRIDQQSPLYGQTDQTLA